MQRNLYQAYVINKITSALSAGPVIADNPGNAEIMAAMNEGIESKDLHDFVIVVIHIGTLVDVAREAVEGLNE